MNMERTSTRLLAAPSTLPFQSPTWILAQLPRGARDRRQKEFFSRPSVVFEVPKKRGGLLAGASFGPLTAWALKDERRGRRLVDVIRRIPAFSKEYFKSPFRRALFGGISLLGGFYVAQTISLSFGALGVNDVIASVLCVLFTEYVTRFYHTRPRATFPVALLNNFKMGFSYGLFIDAFKLAS